MVVYIFGIPSIIGQRRKTHHNPLMCPRASLWWLIFTLIGYFSWVFLARHLVQSLSRLDNTTNSFIWKWEPKAITRKLQWMKTDKRNRIREEFKVHNNVQLPGETKLKLWYQADRVCSKVPLRPMKCPTSGKLHHIFCQKSSRTFPDNWTSKKFSFLTCKQQN